MKAVAFSPAAEADIDEIWDYSATRWGSDQADDYIDAIRDACNALARGTKQGRTAEVLPDFQKHPCGSHVIFSGLSRPSGRDSHPAPTAGC